MRALQIEGPEDLVGTSVWGTGGNELGFGHDGTHAELLTVPVGALVPLPSTLGAGPQKVLVTAVAAGARGRVLLIPGAGGG
jgi:NADPH:quinone reductase-like Zn-dependent oxidoreductase